MQKKWYTLYTKENCEKKVSYYFNKRGIECYCPLNKIIKTGFLKSYIISYEPLFKDYVFILLDQNNLSFINDNDNIINFVFWLGRPVVLTEFEIINIKNFVSRYQNIKLKKTAVKISRMNGIASKLYRDNWNEDIDDADKNIFGITIDSLGFRMFSDTEKKEIILNRDSVFGNKIVS
jgi:transcription antitermination factor NusG